LATGRQAVTGDVGSAVIAAEPGAAADGGECAISVVDSSIHDELAPR
jgi:hypothetical protein